MESVDDDLFGESVSQRGGDSSSMVDDEEEQLPDGEISVIERRRRVLECFSDMMGSSMVDMQNYFSDLDQFRTLSKGDQETLYNAAILEILILKCYFTFNGTTFIHPTTREELVSRESLLLGTNDYPFVSQFIELFTKMYNMQFKESDTLLLMCISLFDTARAELGQLEDREGIMKHRQDFVMQFVNQFPKEHMADAMLLLTTLKDLKSAFRDILMRTYTNRNVQLSDNVSDLIKMMYNGRH